MRVLMIAEQLRRAVPGGIGTYVRGLAQGLHDIAGFEASGAVQPYRVDVTLFASRAPGDRKADPLLALGFPVRCSNLPGPALTRSWDLGLLKLPPAGLSVDVVHATSLATAASPAPLTATVHDVAWRVLPDAFPARGRRWHEAALARAVERAARLIVPSHATADALLATGVGAERVVVIEEGCDHLPPPDFAAATSLLERLGVRGPYLLSVSTLEPRKNLARLLTGYEEALPGLPEPWPLVVAGPPGWGPGLSPAPGAVLAGRVEPQVLSALYARARALVYVPLVEGFGLPAVEAMAAGTPVVASPMPSTGTAAHTVDPVDAEAIASAIVAVGTDDKLRRRLVIAGRGRARELTWATTARRHIEVWSGLT
jgi:glycosyltransferase involved in cell wall biosynthesis